MEENLGVKKNQLGGYFDNCKSILCMQGDNLELEE
jgi:hypothetical protein